MSADFHKLTILLGLVVLLAFSGCGSSKPPVCNVAGTCCGTPALCPATNLLLANSPDGHIASYRVTAEIVLSPPTLTPSSPSSLGMATLGNQFLYADNGISLSGSSIEAWSIAPGSRTLTTVQGSPFSLGIFSLAGGLATNPGTQMLYVADGGKIDALKIGATGALSPITGSPFTSGTNLFLTLDTVHNFLFASDDDPPGGVLAFTFDATGALTAVPGSPFPASTNLGVNSQPTEIVVDASSSFVYTALNATGQVAGFAINTSTGALTPVPGSPFTAGNGPLAITATTSVQAGNYLYVSNALDGTVSGYSINSTNGVLTPVTGSPFSIAAGALTTNGSILYTSTAAGIRVFNINPQSGALAEVNGSPFPGPGATVLAFVQ